jgi:hypothetical protein
MTRPPEWAVFNLPKEKSCCKQTTIYIATSSKYRVLSRLQLERMPQKQAQFMTVRGMAVLNL